MLKSGLGREGGWCSPYLKVSAYMDILRAVHCPVSSSVVDPGQVHSCLKPLQFNTSLCFSHALVGTLRSLHCNSWGNSVRLSKIFVVVPWLPEGWELCPYSGVTMLGLRAALGAARVYPCFLSLGVCRRSEAQPVPPPFRVPKASWFLLSQAQHRAQNTTPLLRLTSELLLLLIDIK